MSPIRLLAAALFLLSGAAYAIPELQLTIPGGSYNNGTQTTVASGQSFTLYALFDPKQDDLTTNFYISASLEAGTGDSPVTGAVANGGSFIFAGNTVNVAGDMVNGTPGGLPTHGDFPTWYYVSAPFTFSILNQTAAFDAQTSTPASISGGCLSNCIYFTSFGIDTSLLNPNYSIHFDLFDQATLDGANGISAPFSHDAQSALGGCGRALCLDPKPDVVAEPTSLALIAIAVAALVGGRRMIKPQ